MLDHVAKKITEGYMSGYYPYWSLSCEDYDKLSDGDLTVLADFILAGYTSGYLEVCTDPDNDEIEETIYWEIDYNKEEMENDDGLTVEDI